jgi:hypothetical protein
MTRIRELIQLVRQRHPNDKFFHAFEDSCRVNPSKRKVYRTYNDALRVLDDTSWQLLKAKAVLHFRDHRRGQLKQGFFNQLNEAFAYRHLVRQGYTDVVMLPETGRRVPDLQYRVGDLREHCEVKTLNISDEEIDRRESRKAFSNVYVRLGEGFFKKLSDAIAVARGQINAQGTGGLVFVVVIWDDIALDSYRTYRRELSAFARARGIGGVHIKVGLRFNRRMRL